ncbi:PP2C family protein-serine/threonine phosphatase [Tundrisphaera lichenicola]|uniref:PP2C family protein-serine/threonine phosphatase n=1 Tax=Tundrisphaera lichenicola TaxID=2029860 RepID=UPI003EBAFD73
MPEAREVDTTEYEFKDGPSDPPKSPRRPVEVEFAAISDPGRVRTNNEDHYLITRMSRTYRPLRTNMPAGELPDPFDDVAYGMVVADGMGGMSAGEKASQLAIRTGVELVLNSPRWATRIDEEEARHLIGRMCEYFRKVDNAVIGQARAHRGLRGMGTTLTLAYSVGIDVFIVHVGDSRAYLHRAGGLSQLTRDHTVAQNLADVGAIKPEEVHRHNTRHVLTNFVGGPTHGVDPEIATLQVRDGDTLLLCSDGLTEMVEDSDIAAILDKAPTPDDAARSLIDRALANGGRDNVTVVLARYTIPPAG